MMKLVFPGTASSVLAHNLVALHPDQLELGNHEVVRFANSEVKVTVTSNVTDRSCIVLQSTSNPTDEHIMELLLTIDALKREGAAKVTAIIPYFGYARQDIQHRPGECVSANVIIKILESLKVDKVVTVDLHDEATGGIFTIPFQHMSALPMLAARLYTDLVTAENPEESFIVGSPDQGGMERARIFADSFYKQSKEHDIITTEKKRNLQGVHDSKALELYGEVKGKKVILVDDISTSGGTMLHAAALCLEKGALEVYSVVVHPDFGVGVPEKIQNCAVKKFYTTNSIEKTPEDLSKYSKIEIVDIASVFLF